MYLAVIKHFFYEVRKTIASQVIVGLWIYFTLVIVGLWIYFTLVIVGLWIYFTLVIVGLWIYFILFLSGRARQAAEAAAGAERGARVQAEAQGAAAADAAAAAGREAALRLALEAALRDAVRDPVSLAAWRWFRFPGGVSLVGFLWRGFSDGASPPGFLWRSFVSLAGFLWRVFSAGVSLAGFLWRGFPGAVRRFTCQLVPLAGCSCVRCWLRCSAAQAAFLLLRSTWPRRFSRYSVCPIGRTDHALLAEGMGSRSTVRRATVSVRCEILDRPMGSRLIGSVGRRGCGCGVQAEARGAATEAASRVDAVERALLRPMWSL